MYDVTIIGAGLAGLHAARVLAQGGAKVLLVDRKTRPDSYVHTTGIFVRRTFEDFGFPDGMLGAAVRDVTLYAPSGRSMEMRSDHDEFRVGDMRAIYRFLLDRCLALGVELAPSTFYVGSEVDRHWSLVRLRSGARTKSIRTRFLVGADGARSRVAIDLGLDRNQSFVIGAEEVHRDERGSVTPRLHAFLDPSLAPGYIGWITEDGEAIHIGAGGSRPFDTKGSVARLRAKAQSIVGRELGQPAERRGGLIPAGGVLRKIANRRGLLIGDAAGAVSPLTAGGLDGALRLSDYAAKLIGQAVERHDSSLLLRYRGDLLRTRFVSRIWMRTLLERITAPWIAEAGFRVLASPPLQPFVRHVFFGRGSFPDPSVILGEQHTRVTT